MNYVAKLVRDYYNSGLDRMRFDTDILTVCVENLSAEAEQYILEHKDDTVHTSDVKYKFFMKRLLHRYKDIVAGYTNVDDDGCITFSTLSSIIEMCDDTTMYKLCRENGIRRMHDITEDKVHEMPMDLAAQLLGKTLAFTIEENNDC